MVTVKPSSIKSCAPNFKDVAKHEPFGKYLHIDAKSVSVHTSDKNHRSTLRAINKFVSSEILSTNEFNSKKYTLYDDLKEITIGFDTIVDGVNKKKTTLTIWQKISNGFFAIFGTGIYVESIKAANISKSLHAKLTDLEGAVKKRNDFLATVSRDPRMTDIQ